MKARTAYLACVLVLVSAQASGQELGRLFFTPEQRSSLDARRKARIPDKPAAVVVESPVTRLDGYVSRSGGKSTVWVNGEPIPEGTQPDGLRVRPQRGNTGRVTVDIGENENQVDLKIGQSFDRGTGEVRDSLEGGEISVIRRPRPRSAR